jgi:hypothetical protein
MSHDVARCGTRISHMPDESLLLLEVSVSWCKRENLDKRVRVAL